MTPPHLVVLGASVRAAAMSACAAGLRPYGIDLFADCDLTALGPAVRIADYPADFEAQLAAAPDAPWLYTGGLENYPRLVDRLAKIRPLLGNRGDVLRRVRDVPQLARVAEAAGCRFPMTITSRLAIPRDVDASRTWLLKTPRGSGGLHVRQASRSDLSAMPRGYFLQEFIAGESRSASFVAAEGGAVLVGRTRQLLASDWGQTPPFAYLGSIGPLRAPAIEESLLQQLGERLAREFNLVGLFGVDYVRSERGLFVIEVNPRYTASMEILERASSTSFVGLHLAACQHGKLPAVTPRASGRIFGKAVAYASHPGLISPQLDDLVATFNPPGQPPRLADLPHVGTHVTTGQPLLTVLAEGESASLVETTLRDLAEKMGRLIVGPFS